MNQTLLFALSSVLILMPGFVLLSTQTGTLVLAMAIMELLLSIGGIYLATRPGRRNPVKFTSILPVVILMILSEGYISKIAHLSGGISQSSTNILTISLFMWEFGICGLLAYESSNNLNEILHTSGYEESEFMFQTNRMTSFMLSIATLSVVSSYLIYLFIVSVPKLNINPLFALVFFGVLYLVITRFYSISRSRD